MKNRPIKLLLLLLMAQAIVIPHSTQTLTAVTLIITFVIAVYRLSVDRKIHLTAIDYWILVNIIVNTFYIFIGLNNDAYEGFVPIVMVSTIVAPILWVWVAKAIYSYSSEKEIISSFYWLSILGAVSVSLFFFFFLTFGSYAVGFWIDETSANITFSDGQVAATMAVYGSFIFSAAAFASSLEIVRNLAMRIFIILVIFIVAATSGRSALMLSIVIGGIIGIAVKTFNQNPDLKGRNGKAIAGYLALAAVALLLLIIIDIYSVDIDLSVTASNLLEKLSEGGGAERQWQYDALMQGIRDTSGFGAGHGVGVGVIRSEEHPWRYEILPIATIFRVGVIGFILLIFPFLLYIGRFVVRLFTTGVDPFDTFMFAGFIAFLVASATNPYPESFIFQFAIFIPIVLFEMKYRRRHRKHVSQKMPRQRQLA